MATTINQVFPDGERLARLEVAVEKIDEKIDSNHEAYMKKFDEHKQVIDDFIKAADSKYANKWVEDTIKRGVAIILIAVLVAVLSYVIFNNHSFIPSLP